MLQAEVEADRDDREKEYALNRQGSVFAFVVMLILVVAGAALLFMDKDSAGFASIVTVIGGMGGLGIFMRKNNFRRDRGLFYRRMKDLRG